MILNNYKAQAFGMIARSTDLSSFKNDYIINAAESMEELFKAYEVVEVKQLNNEPIEVHFVFGNKYCIAQIVGMNNAEFCAFKNLTTVNRFDMIAKMKSFH